MVITEIAPLTGALSREVNNVPWQQSNYMHVLVTKLQTRLKKMQLHKSSAFTVCIGNEAPVTLTVFS